MRIGCLSLYSFNSKNKKAAQSPNNFNVSYNNNYFKYISYPRFGSNFLTKIDGLICPCCGIKMVSPDTFNAKLTREALSGTGEKTLEVIAGFVQYMHPTERKCFNLLKKMSKKYPDSTLQELLIKAAPRHLEKLQMRQLRILDRIDIHTKELPESAQVQIIAISTKSREIITKDSYNTFIENKNPFQRKPFIASIEQLKALYPDNKAFDEVLRYSQMMPNSTNDVDAFFIKYSRRNSAAIGQRLVSKSVSTIEHIHPQSLDGENGERNYLAECAGCNNSRGSILMNDWMALHPNMFQNLRKYINGVIEEIKTSVIVGHNSYPKTVIKTIQKETLANEVLKEIPSKSLMGKFEQLITDLKAQVKAAGI